MVDDPNPGPRKAAVLGKPIEHSKSPLLHLAAYRALGLTGWTYDRIECTGEELAGLVGGLGDEWVGVSVTMPGKFAALEFATERTERAVIIGSANTLVRVPGGWRADCTDVDGVTGALRSGGVRDLRDGSAVVVGSGGTSRPALVGLTELGVRHVTVVARDESRARATFDCLGEGVDAQWMPFDAAGLGQVCADADVMVSTVPADAAAPYADVLARAPFILDAIYDPWPTPLATAAKTRGSVVISGLHMLLNQAFGQVEQFTGLPAPREAMARAVGLDYV
ncbi:shikimate dehydrogenase [Rhodococcus coprophilus]|uniref:Shikimate 5-dehydrogenase n=1 Tax=Rhodococcus coprophilus TaxID=38310 RepID=A0A2X4TNE5_9NOCA|nr:shikimate dehydrogenase [Rhodococcus coprophilus]MBM7461134.1 shikimate dehydrogenase [Rhodococcus coprophilus]SQI28936.1 shikimate 5-dehydrogenase [Rhodococcus coprophilus]